MAGDKKSGIGRQIHLPLRRAFLISLKSIKIRFWRSVITAAGIFLGIAFLVSVLAQMALQVPPTPIEVRYPNVYIRGMVGHPVDTPLVAGLSAKGMIKLAGDYAPKADRSIVTVINKAGDKVVLDFTKPEAADYRLAGGDMVFVPNRSGRSYQLLISLLVIVLVIGALVIVKRVEPRPKRVGVSAGIVVVGFIVMAIGLNNAGLSPPSAPRVTVIESYHVAGEVRIPSSISAGKGATLDQALAGAGGFGKNADRKHITVMVRDKGKVELDLSTTAGSALAASMRLRAGDLVYVPDASARNRQLWLVIMSLIVCTIGITNSMLMSVTERFKEIGTMKCLGALDKFVVELFLLESTFLGLFASFAGWLVGFGLMAGLAVASQGWGLLAQLSFAEVLRMLGIAMAAGTTLTMIATIAPAVRAAQMPPAAALRVEI